VVTWPNIERPRTVNTALAMVEAERLPPGLFLTWLREEAGKTLREVAEEIGVSAPYWSDVEHGRRGVTPERYPNIAAALNTRVQIIEQAMRQLPCGFCGRTGPRRARGK